MVAGASAGVLLSEPGDGQPLALFLGLLAFGVITEPTPFVFKRVAVSGSFLSVALATVLLGPLPAVIIGWVLMVENAVRRRTGFVDHLLPNLATYAVFPLVGHAGFALLGKVAAITMTDLGFIAAAAGIFMIMNLVNFLLIAIDIQVVERRPTVWESLRSVWGPAFPVELVSSLLTAAVAYTYIAYGGPALLLMGLVAIAFQSLMRLALEAASRKDEVEARNEQLASLQVGLIATTLKTLSLRDNRTARHSAAVARYSREVARTLGLSEEEQELIHTAALFHDIGKFIFPDSILLTDRQLTEEEFEIVREHPAVGAKLISEIDGYGPVAEIVCSHHERMDGLGYPAGLTGDLIPLGARIIAVADIYDVITARDTYRQPVSVPEALEELRRSAGTQLDPDVVEVFVDLIERTGLRFQHQSEADFEAELALGRRVREYAAPRPVDQQHMTPVVAA